MRQNTIRCSVSVIAIAASLSVAAPAHAQAPSASEVQEVIVTARRQAEDIQSTPVSVAAFSAEALRENSVQTPEDLQISTPGVYLSGNGGRQNTNFVIRGQSKALSGPSSPAVLNYFAEVPNPNFGSYVPQFDLSSIQVLKGPQGTLFGRNTTGGAVLFTPAAPTGRLEGYVQGSYGNYDAKEIEGVLNIPLGERVRLRLGGQKRLRDGYTKDLNHPGRKLDNIDDYTVRATLWVEPFEGLTNSTILDYYKSDTHGFATVLSEVFPGNTLLTLLGLQNPFRQLLAQQQARGPFIVNQQPLGYEHNKRFSVTNRTEWELGPATLINIFGYRSTRVGYNTDVGTPRAIADGTGAIPAGVPVDLIYGSLDNAIHQYSDELQLRGALADGKLEWLIGGFYLNSKPSGPHGNTVGFAQIPGFGDARAAYNFITEKSKAAFANVRYDLDSVADGLQFEAGIRHTRDTVESCTGIGPTSLSFDVEPDECKLSSATLSNVANTTAKSKGTTWSVGLNWQANKDVFLYAVTRRGYRAGGVNSPSFSGRLVPFQTFSPETVTDIEAGLRSDFDVGGGVRVRFNATGFVGWYKDVQTALTGVQSVIAACTPGASAPISADGDCNPNNDPAGGTLLVNIGNSRVSGIDIDGEIRLTPALSLNYGGNILWPVTTRFNVAPTLTPFVSETKIPFNNTAKKTLTAGVRYRLPLSDNLGEVILNADYYWSDKLLYIGTSLPSYDVVNARVDWNNIGGRSIDASIFVRNLLDEDYTAAANASGAFLGITTVIYGPPRTYGVELRYRFGG